MNTEIGRAATPAVDAIGWICEIRVIRVRQWQFRCSRNVPSEGSEGRWYPKR